MITVPDLILAQAHRSPTRAAIESAGGRLTYAQVAAHAGGLARHLRRMGVRPGDLVAVAVRRGVDLTPTLIGVQLAGAAYVPLDPEHPVDRLNFILRDAGARVLVTSGATAVPGLRADRRVDLSDVDVRPGPDEPSALALDSAAYAIYTSGSTGRPKGVLVTHRALANFIGSMRERPGLPEDVVLPAITTVSFDIAALELFLPLTTGGRVVVARPHETTDPHRLAALLARTGATVLQATPTTWRLLLEAGWSPPPGFTVLCGGERLPAALAERLLGDRVVLWDLYGPTETTIWSAVTRFRRGEPTAFHPVRRTRFHVLDDRLGPVVEGAPGELYIGGAGLAVGYLGRPALTSERFVADPYGHDRGARLYRTGDLVRRHLDGRIEILGRADDQIKIRGFRIEPGEIENVLVRHPGVAEAAVRAVNSAAGAPRLIGYVRPTDPAAPPDPRPLRRHLARSVPAYMVPAELVVLDRFPRTPNGKLDRSALPMAAPPEATPLPPPNGRAPGGSADTGIRQRVTDILAGLLRQPSIGPHDDFFALGGDSLLAIEAVNRLNAELHTHVQVNALFDARTVARLCALVDGDGAADPPLTRATGRPRLSSTQWRLWLHQRLAPESTAHNESLAIRLPGQLDVPALEAALSGVVARHDTLRTRYAHDDSGQLVPIVVPVQRIRLEVEHGDPRTVLEAELDRPFDLAAAPPLRLRLVRRGDDECVLLLAVHGIAADHRSRELIADEIRAAYRGRTVAVPALRYADYAHWQRSAAAGPAARRRLDFWRAALAGLVPAELRTDRPRPAGAGGRAGTIRFAVGPAQVDELRATADEHDANVFVGLLATFSRALAGHVRGSDLTVGVPVSLRDRPELDDLVGPVDNIVVVRIELGDEPTFDKLLTRVRDAALAVQQHAATPYEDIVAAVLEADIGAPDPGRNPLFDVAFEVRGVADPATLPPPDAPGARFDLRCLLTERADGGLDGRIEYATGLFDAATAAALADSFVSLCSQRPAGTGVRRCA